MNIKRLLSLLLLTCLCLVSCNTPPKSDGTATTTDTTAPEPPICDGAHVWSEWSYHTLNALRTRHCEVCGFDEYHRVEDHVFENWQYVAPTCCDVGGFTATCSICPQECTYYYTRQTGAHVFRADRYSDRHCCTVCGLTVLEYGQFGKDNALTYYIEENYSGDLRMTVSGMGEIPDFSADNPPPWLESEYLSVLKTITLEPGITRIGANAFSAHADGTNPYASVAQFVYKNTLLDTTPDADLSGVRAVATYRWDGMTVHSSEATAYFLRYIVEQYDTENLTFGDLPAWMFWFYLYDMTGDGQEELIVRTGSCEADAQYIFYTYSDKNVREVGRVGATHTGISGISDGTGVIWHHGSQGWESADRITISDGGLVRETLIEPQPVDGYTVFENAVMLISYTREQATNFTGGKG